MAREKNIDSNFLWQTAKLLALHLSNLGHALKEEEENQPNNLNDFKIDLNGDSEDLENRLEQMLDSEEAWMKENPLRVKLFRELKEIMVNVRETIATDNPEKIQSVAREIEGLCGAIRIATPSVSASIEREAEEEAKSFFYQVEDHTPLHVAVYSFGGLISEVKLHNDRDEAIEEMNIYLDEEGFDSEVDDARIFVNGEEVYSYSLPSEREPNEEVDELMDEYKAGTNEMSSAEADEAAADLMDEE